MRRADAEDRANGPAWQSGVRSRTVTVRLNLPAEVVELLARHGHDLVEAVRQAVLRAEYLVEERQADADAERRRVELREAFRLIGIHGARAYRRLDPPPKTGRARMDAFKALAGQPELAALHPHGGIQPKLLETLIVKRRRAVRAYVTRRRELRAAGHYLAGWNDAAIALDLGLSRGMARRYWKAGLDLLRERDAPPAAPLAGEAAAAGAEAVPFAEAAE